MSGTSQHSTTNVAVKILDKQRIIAHHHGLNNLFNEIKVHWSLADCDGILHMLEIYEDEFYVYLVLEYQQDGSLLNEII